MYVTILKLYTYTSEIFSQVFSCQDEHHIILMKRTAPSPHIVALCDVSYNGMAKVGLPRFHVQALPNKLNIGRCNYRLN